MRKRLGDILVEKGYLTMEQVEEGLKIQRQSSERERKLIGEILVDRGMVTEAQVKEALEAQD